MDKNSIYLEINVNYANLKFKIKEEKVITYNKLKEESIKHFNIEIKNGDNIEFIYIDEDQEKNILQHNDEDIYSTANFIDNNYLLNLDLIIIKKQNFNIKNKINENKNQVNNIKASLNNKEKKREINNNMLENKLKQIDCLFKNQFYLMQNDITKMINNKYKEIENELKKLNVEVNNKNNNEIILEDKIEKSKKHVKNQNQKENKLNKKNENKNKKDKSNKDYMLNKKDIISPNNIIKEKDDLEFFNNFVNDELDEGEENNLVKDDYMNADGSTAFNFNNIKLNDAKFEKIMKSINSLYKNKNYSYNDIKTNGNNIFEIMNKDKEMNGIDVIEINKYIKHYLTKGQKRGLPLNEKIKYCNILKYLNYFLKIKNIQTTLDDKLKNKIELEINIENIKEKNIEISKENTKDEKKLINFMDSLIKNNNKIYVQQKIEEIFNSL